MTMSMTMTNKNLKTEMTASATVLAFKKTNQNTQEVNIIKMNAF